MSKFSIKICRQKPKEEGESSIIFRISYRGQRKDLYSGYTCSLDKWDVKRGWIKNGSKVNGFEYKNINASLRDMEDFITDYFNSDTFRSGNTSLDDLKERFNYKYKRGGVELSDEFFFLFDKFIKEQEEQRGWDKSMKEVFVRLKELVKAYKPKITFADLTVATMDGLKNYLSQTMLNEALIKRLSYFKQFIKWAQGKGCKIHEEYFTYAPKLPKSKIAIQYLSRDEVNTIYNLKLEPFSVMDIVRDAFIFQCYTALRYSDIKALKHNNIIKTDDGYEIDIVTEKDDDRIHIPLSKIAISIYNKYKEFKYPADVVFPIMSNQKYNKHLKELGVIADLKGEWISYEYRLTEKIVVKTPKSDLCSHTARRTFITLSVESGVPLDLISQITSHSEIKAMKPYIATTKEGLRKVISSLDEM